MNRKEVDRSGSMKAAVPVAAVPVPEVFNQRHEIKYVVDELTAEALREFLQPYVIPDPHVRDHAAYPVVSLYFDTPDLAFYHGTAEGRTNRFKLRMRHYRELDGPIFFEIKRRLADVIVKQRACLSRRLAIPWLHGDLRNGDLPPMSPKETISINQFRALALSLSAGPKTLIQYSREAWVGRFDSSLRITFDRNITTTPCFSVEEFINNTGDKGESLFHIPVVLEVKFSDGMPPWINHLVRRFNLLRTSIAKYQVAIENLRRFGFSMEGISKGAYL